MNTLVGTVTSLKTPKTATVAVTRIVIHPFYKKRLRKIKRFKVHYEDLPSLAVGNRVKISETRPISKDKHFKIIQILSS